MGDLLRERLNSLKNRPKLEIVNGLLDTGNVEHLTNLKVGLVAECRELCILGFPTGQLYTRRKPKDRSQFKSLEERLANDIVELFICLDTRVVTSNIKAMFKPSDNDVSLVQFSQHTDVSTRVESEETLNFSLDENLNDIQSEGLSYGTPLIDASQAGSVCVRSTLTHKSCVERITSLEADIFLMRERYDHEIRKIIAMISEKESIIRIQGEEINHLKASNRELQTDLNGLKSTSFQKQNNQNNSIDKALHSGKTKDGLQMDNDLNCRKETSRIVKSVDLGNIGASVASDNSSNVTSTSCIQLPHAKCNERIELFELDKNGNNSIDTNLIHANNSMQEDNDPTQENFIQSQQIRLNNSVDIITPAAVEDNNSTLENHCLEPKSDKRHSEGIKTNTLDSATNIVDDSISNSDGFIGVKRKRANVKRFFLSGIADTVTTETIVNYLRMKNINPTHLRLFPSRRKGTLSAKLNVLASESLVLTEDGFWPKFVSCKPWLTRGKLDKQRQDKKSE